MPALCSSAGILLFLSAVVKSKKGRQAAEGFVYSLILKHHGRQKESATISKKQNLTPALLDIHLHCLVLDGVYLNRDGAAVFHEAAPPTVEELEALLAKIIQRVMRLLTRPGALIEEQDQTYLAETDSDGALKSLQAASCTYRFALGPRAGQKVLSLQNLPSGAIQTVSRAYRPLSDRAAWYKRGGFIKRNRN